MSRFGIWHCSYYITRLGCCYWCLPFWATGARFLCLSWSPLPWSSSVSRGEQLVVLGLLCLSITAWGAEMWGRESCKGTIVTWPVLAAGFQWPPPAVQGRTSSGLSSQCSRVKTCWESGPSWYTPHALFLPSVLLISTKALKLLALVFSQIFVNVVNLPCNFDTQSMIPSS